MKSKNVSTCADWDIGSAGEGDVELIADVESRVYSTQENGAIIVEVGDGESLKLLDRKVMNALHK